MNLAQAKSTMDRVRLAYKDGSKSNNKAYSLDIQSDKVSYKELKKESGKWQDLPSELFDKMSKDKMSKRFENSEKEFKSLSKPLGTTNQEMGGRIWNFALFDRGNCAEMAACSTYLAIKDYGADYKKVWCGTIMRPGDHVFCLVGPPPPAASVKDMSGTSLVIDPWLHVFCYAFEYATFAERQLEKWNRDGKRVFARGGWSSTSGEYKENFLTAPLVFAH